MNENEALDIMKEAAKEIVKDVYDDAGKPVTKPTGELLGLIPRAIKAALSPVEKWVLQREYNVEETKRLLEQKLEHMSPELIEAPEPYIAVPALQYISYCMDNDELRDMYANLLANSMNKVVKNGVHPGFVEIIKQLSPDEAKILKCFYANEYNRGFATIEFRVHKKEGGYNTLVKRFTNVAELCNCENTYDYEKYIDNLLRLGLLREIGDAYLTDSSLYENLENHSFIVNLKKQIESNEEINNKVKKIDFSKGIIELTSFGKSFCSMCLETKNAEVIGSEAGDPQ